jgi:hypothetical protein
MHAALFFQAKSGKFTFKVCHVRYLSCSGFVVNYFFHDALLLVQLSAGFSPAAAVHHCLFLPFLSP